MLDLKVIIEIVFDNCDSILFFSVDVGVKFVINDVLVLLDSGEVCVVEK